MSDDTERRFNMKKGIMIIAVILVVIIGLVVSGNIALNSFRAFLMGEPDVIQEVVSPNGKYSEKLRGK